MKRRFRKPVVAAQWDRTGLDYVVAELRGGHVTITAAGSLSRLPEDESLASAAENETDEPSPDTLPLPATPPLASQLPTGRSPGEMLKEELQQLNIRQPELLVALGRAQVDVMPLQLPPASDVELPTLVVNQVIRDTGDTSESGAIDYVTLDADEGQPRKVFAFMVDGNTLEEVRQEAGHAGLRLESVAYRPLASLTLLQRLVPQSRRTMVLVTIHDWEADLTILRNGRLFYTRTARLVETGELTEVADQLAVEVRRSLAAATLTADAEDQHVYVFGSLDESERFVQLLADQLALPTSLLDPLRREQLQGPVNASAARLAPLIGLVHEHFGESHMLDFVHPKRPPAPPNYYRRAAVYIGALVVLVCMGGYHAWEVYQENQGQLETMRAELDAATFRLNKVKQKQAVVEAIWNWETDNVNWLDELYDLAKRLPNGRDATIRRMTISPGSAGQLVIDLSVQVRHPDVITQMGEQLRDAYHDVRSKGVSEQSSSTDYPWSFETRITLRKRDVEAYRQTAPTPPDDGNLASTPVNPTQTQ